MELGTNLRLELIDDFVNHCGTFPVVEIIADNWLEEGPHHQKLAKIREQSDLLMHCVGMNLAGYDELNFTYLEKLKTLRDAFQPRHLSDHLCVQAHQGVYFHDLLPFARTKVALDRVVERVDRLQEYFGQELVIENLVTYVSFDEHEMGEAEFLAEVVRHAGCKILLDLNNLWINEQNGGASAKLELEHLPLEAVREIHIAGGETQGQWLVDTHGRFPATGVLQLCQQQLIREVPVIFERDNNLTSVSDLKRELGRIDEVIRGE